MVNDNPTLWVYRREKKDPCNDTQFGMVAQGLEGIIGLEFDEVTFSVLAEKVRQIKGAYAEKLEYIDVNLAIERYRNSSSGDTTVTVS